MNKTILALVLVGSVNMHAGESDVHLHHEKDIKERAAQQVVPTPQEPDENTRRKVARAELLPFLHNDVISLVLAYAAKSWNECVRNREWSWIEPDVEQNKKIIYKKDIMHLNNGNSVQTLAGLGYVYEDHEKIPLYKQLADARVLRHMGRVTGLIGCKNRSVYLDPKTQTIDNPTHTLPNVIPADDNAYIMNAFMSASGRKMVVRTYNKFFIGRLDSYALDQDKGTLTKKAFSSSEENDYQCLAVSDKRVALSGYDDTIIVRDETRELCTIHGCDPLRASFMGNTLLVTTTYDKLIFIDTSRTVPSGSNRIIGMIDYPLELHDRDLTVCAETGRIFITPMKDGQPEDVDVLQLGVAGSD